MSEINELKQGFAISDVALAVIRTKNKNYAVKTASEVEFKAVVEQGQEKVLRKKDTILALTKTNDLVKGYDVVMTDLLLHPEVLGIVEGGVVQNASEDGGTFKNFKGPVAGAPVVREAVGIDFYCENVDTGGKIESYMKFSVENCKGKPTDLVFKDGEFYTPKLTMESRPEKGQNTIDVELVKTLPDIT